MKSVDILQTRAAQYGSFEKNVESFNRYKTWFAPSLKSEGRVDEVVRECFNGALDLTSSLTALKLARIRTVQSIECKEDSVRDFFNYCYLFADTVFKPSVGKNLDGIQLELYRNKPEQLYFDEAVVSMLVSYFKGVKFDQSNYQNIVHFADDALKRMV